jgi:ubiquinone/menaquinone biosynthesis C-methylase UbiE
MQESLSFDSMVELYDETRIFDQHCFDAALDYLTSRFPPARFLRLFEPGIGTGRIAIPFAKRGYQVTGVDISLKMLALLDKQVAAAGLASKITAQCADAITLPYADASFDMAIEVFALYWIGDWKRAARELLRVVRKEGPIIIMHTGGGAEAGFINSRYCELCAAHKVVFSRPGAESVAEIEAYYRELGCHTELLQNRWGFITRLLMNQILDYLRRRAFSFATIAPDPVHNTVMQQIELEQSQHPGGLTREVELNNQIKLVVVER